MSFSATALVEQSVQVAERPEASFHRPAVEYVTGTSLRGAFASRWIAENDLPANLDASKLAEFTALFHGEISWGMLRENGASVTPLSALTHKYDPAPGCVNPQGFDRAHLLNTDAPGFVGQRCGCGGWLEPGKGKWRGTTAAQSRTRAGLQDVGGRREQARDGHLFTREGIAAGVTLNAHIGGRHPWLNNLAAGDESITIRLGSQLSVHGRCTATLTDQQDGHDAQPARLGDPNVVIIRAESPAVFVDGGGRPQLEPWTVELAERVGTDCDIVARWARPTAIGGWDLASGLPKPEEIAAIAGSTWVIKFTEPLDRTALAELATGVGLRRVEGYGAVTINPPPYTQPGQPELVVETSTEPEASAAASQVDAVAGVPVVVSAVRAAATDIRQQFRNEQADWAAGLLIELASEKLSSSNDDAAAAVDRASSRSRFTELSALQRQTLRSAATHPAETITKIATLIKAGL